MHKKSSTISRRKFAVLIGTAVAVVAAVAAVAFFYAKAPISGGVDTNAFKAEWFDGGSYPPSLEANGLDGSVSIQGDSLQLVIDEGFPGGSLTVTAYAKTTGESGRAIGVELPGLPEGFTAALTEDTCGTTVGDSMSRVAFTVTMDEDAEPGASGDFTDGAGLMVAPSSQVSSPVTCEPYIGQG